MIQVTFQDGNTIIAKRAEFTQDQVRLWNENDGQHTVDRNLIVGIEDAPNTNTSIPDTKPGPRYTVHRARHSHDSYEVWDNGWRTHTGRMSNEPTPAVQLNMSNAVAREVARLLNQEWREFLRNPV